MRRDGGSESRSVPAAAGARAAAFEALREVLSAERWDDPLDLARAAFAAGWYAGSAWHAMQGTHPRHPSGRWRDLTASDAQGRED